MNNISVELLLLIVVGGFGLVNCFFGYRFFRFLLTVWGLVLGATLGSEFIGHYFEYNRVAVGLGGFLGGAVGAIVFTVVYFLGVFLIGAASLVGATDSLVTLAGFQMHPVFLLIPAVIGGVLALLLQKILIIILTSVAGACAIVAAGAAHHFGLPVLDVLRTPQLLQPHVLAAVGVVAVLAVMGMVVQFFITGTGMVGRRGGGDKDEE